MIEFLWATMLKYKATTRVLKTFTTWAKDWGFALASEVLVGVSGFSSSLGIKAIWRVLRIIGDSGKLWYRIQGPCKRVL